MNCWTWVLAALMFIGAVIAVRIAWRIHKFAQKVREEKERLERENRENRRKISDR